MKDYVNQEKAKTGIEKRMANLNPQKAGEPSHNPHGRPPGPSLVEAAKRLYREHPERLDMIIAALEKQCNKGNVKATAELKEWLDGKAVSPIDMTAKVSLDAFDDAYKKRFQK